MVLNLHPVGEEKQNSTLSTNSQLGKGFVESLAEKLLTTKSCITLKPTITTTNSLF